MVRICLQRDWQGLGIVSPKRCIVLSVLEKCAERQYVCCWNVLTVSRAASVM
jgi:hypothetical protein